MSQAKNATPEWLTETPEHRGPKYLIVMHDEDGIYQQHVEMERAEYLALKQHLAKLRGLAAK